MNECRCGSGGGSRGRGWIRAAGDWLQGPYVYYLYSQYGFDKGDIGRLFIAGFGSSMLFGTIVGSLADKQYVCSLSPSPIPPQFHCIPINAFT
jgi:hypothetical protein